MLQIIWQIKGSVLKSQIVQELHCSSISCTLNIALQTITLNTIYLTLFYFSVHIYLRGEIKIRYILIFQYNYTSIIMQLLPSNKHSSTESTMITICLFCVQLNSMVTFFSDNLAAYSKITISLFCAQLNSLIKQFSGLSCSYMYMLTSANQYTPCLESKKGEPFEIILDQPSTILNNLYSRVGWLLTYTKRPIWNIQCHK